MRRTMIIYCEACGGERQPGTADFVVYHHLSFCSIDCRDEYRQGDEARRARRAESGDKAA